MAGRTPAELMPIHLYARRWSGPSGYAMQYQGLI